MIFYLIFTLQIFPCLGACFYIFPCYNLNIFFIFTPGMIIETQVYCNSFDHFLLACLHLCYYYHFLYLIVTFLGLPWPSVMYAYNVLFSSKAGHICIWPSYIVVLYSTVRGLSTITCFTHLKKVTYSPLSY